MTTTVQFIPANEATALRLAMTPGATVKLTDEQKARMREIDAVTPNLAVSPILSN